MSILDTKTEAWAMLAGSLLLIATMVLHPAGGDFHALEHKKNFIILSHSIAICSVPLLIIGTWGLHKRMKHMLSLFGFTFSCLGFVAAFLAATVNGLVLPFFVGSYHESSQEIIDALKPGFVLIRSLNHAFDFVLIGGVLIAMLLFSSSILKTNLFPKALGYMGLLLPALLIFMLITGFDLLNLYGFRIFALSIVSWFILMGVRLLNLN